MESWLASLQSGNCLAAWDEFLDRYRRLIFAAIRHSSSDPDDIMDVFAHVCEALRDDELARLRKYPTDGTARARFSTWLVAVVHHLAVDWFRHRDGRPQAVPPAALTSRQQEIYRLVFLQQHRQLEAYELLRQRSDSALSHRAFAADLRIAQRAYNDSGHRPRPRTVSLSETLVDPADGSEHSLQASDAQRRVDEALATLSAEERAAVRLFVVEGMPAAEVARTVGWPDAKGVYNRVYRILKSLRQELLSRGVRSGDL
jgi:RNA polymerase sigma factor (sigma-70 family)